MESIFDDIDVDDEIKKQDTSKIFSTCILLFKNFSN